MFEGGSIIPNMEQRSDDFNELVSSFTTLFSNAGLFGVSADVKLLAHHVEGNAARDAIDLLETYEKDYYSAELAALAGELDEESSVSLNLAALKELPAAVFAGVACEDKELSTRENCSLFNSFVTCCKQYYAFEREQEEEFRFAESVPA
jgi:hypothetical protein